MKKESKTSVNNRYIIQSCLNAEEVDVFILINSYQERQQIFKFRRFIQFQYLKEMTLLYYQKQSYQLCLMTFISSESLDSVRYNFHRFKYNLTNLKDLA